MADLEDMGLVSSPHTSAGRIPTEQGYRVFVDTLLTVKPLHSSEVLKLEQGMLADQDPQHLIEHTSQLLSTICQLAGIVMAPRREEQPAFLHIDFVALTGRRILVILVTRDGQVHNRIIQAEREYSPAELVQAANYFNETYAGVSMDEVKRSLLKEILQASDDVHRVMQLAAKMARAALDAEDQPDELVVSGESHLMNIPELGDVRKLRKLFDAFSTKRDLLHLLDRSMRAGGVKIFIGSESGYDALTDYSLVTAPYSADGRVVGTLGVIGPTRMAYEQVISIVDITARLLSGALSGGNRPSHLESPDR
jgi:heat-inducible transcriptional repressor